MDKPHDVSRNSTASRNWKELNRHPASAAYRDLKGKAKDVLKWSLESLGFLDGSPIILDDSDLIVDGWQRQQICLELDSKPSYARLAAGLDPHAYAAAANDARRHDENLDEATARIQQRIVARRNKGESLRTIADAEGVSKDTVARVIEKALPSSRAGVSNCDTCPATVQNEEDKVVGKDGKTYPATKPEVLCPRCQRVGKQEGCEACKEAKVKAKKPPTRTRGTKIVTDRDLEPEDNEEDATVEGVMKRVNHDIEVLARKITALIDEIPKDPWIDKELNLRASIADKLKNAAGALRSAKCTKICPSCRSEGCSSCHRTGRVTQGKYQQLV